MDNGKRRGAREEEKVKLPLWAATTIVIFAGTSLGLGAGYLMTRTASREDAVAAAFASIVKDTQFWDVVRESGYRATMRPELSTGSKARIEMRCMREGIRCAPAPHRGDAEIVVLED